VIGFLGSVSSSRVVKDELSSDENVKKNGGAAVEVEAKK
jgi:hypothetical protein